MQFWQLRFIFKNTYQFLDITSCLYLLLFDIIDAFSPSPQFSGSSIAFLSDLLHTSSHVGTQNRTANRCIQRVHVTIELFTQLTLYLSVFLSNSRYMDQVNDKSICYLDATFSSLELSPQTRIFNFLPRLFPAILR